MRRTRRASSGGRPRAEGDRYPCGKLKPPPPNPAVLAQRRALSGEGGDIAKASNPLDLALARGWITERQHRAGSAYASLYRRARLGAPDREGQGRLEEVREADGARNERFASMSDAAVAAAFDQVFDDAGGFDPEADAAGAMAAWKAANARLSAAQQAEVFLVCLRGSWPQWIIQRAAGRFGTRWEERRTLLVQGLDALSARPARTAPEAAPAMAAVVRPPRAPRGPEERTAYVNPAGELLFEVVRRGRRVR